MRLVSGGAPGAPSWAPFFETLLATSAGAVFALIGAFVLFRVERAAVRRDALDSAVARVTHEHSIWSAKRAELLKTARGSIDPDPGFDLFFDALTGVQLKSTKRERRIIEALHPALRSLLLLEDREKVMHSGRIVRLLVDWRIGASTRQTREGAEVWAAETIALAERTMKVRVEAERAHQAWREQHPSAD